MNAYRESIDQILMAAKDGNVSRIELRMVTGMDILGLEGTMIFNAIPGDHVDVIKLIHKHHPRRLRPLLLDQMISLAIDHAATKCFEYITTVIKYKPKKIRY